MRCEMSWLISRPLSDWPKSNRNKRIDFSNVYYCVGEHRGTLLGRVDQQLTCRNRDPASRTGWPRQSALLPRCILAMSSGELTTKEQDEGERVSPIKIGSAYNRRQMM